MDALGTFAVIDTVPRHWTPDDVTALGDLAASAMTEIELRAETNLRSAAAQRLHLLESVVGKAAAVLIVDADSTGAFDLRLVFANDAYTRLTSHSPCIVPIADATGRYSHWVVIQRGRLGAKGCGGAVVSGITFAVRAGFKG